MGFKISIKDLLNLPRVLRSKGITPLNMLGEETDDPTVISLILSVSMYFHDPDGHLLEYVALLDEEPRPNLGIVTQNQQLDQEKNKLE